MFSKVKINKNQFETIEQLSKELNLSINEIAEFFVEVGMFYCIASRKGKDEAILIEMAEKIQKDERLIRLTQRLEYFYDRGGDSF
jgi:hypothetical protein